METFPGAIFWRVFAAIIYGLLIFGAMFMMFAIIRRCVDGGNCTLATLPHAVIEVVAGAPVITFFAIAFTWPLVVGALILSVIFSKFIEAQPHVWVFIYGLISWPIACAIVDPPRRRGPFLEWWTDRLWSSDGVLFAAPIICVAVTFLYLTWRAERKAWAKQ